jgi:hypothetical protein
LKGFWGPDTHAAALAREDADLDTLERLADLLETDHRTEPSP